MCRSKDQKLSPEHPSPHAGPPGYQRVLRGSWGKDGPSARGAGTTGPHLTHGKGTKATTPQEKMAGTLCDPSAAVLSQTPHQKHKQRKKKTDKPDSIKNDCICVSRVQSRRGKGRPGKNTSKSLRRPVLRRLQTLNAEQTALSKLEDLNRCFSQEDGQMAHERMKRCPTLLIRKIMSK